ncbi:Esterase 6, partial [Orchesella cincta]
LIIIVLVRNSKPGRVETKRHPVLVSISQGKVEGMTLISRLGIEYFGFKGIRYAQVPLRFASPERADNWEGVFYANKTASPCFQFRGTDQRFIGIEDCLTLDIYTPKLEGNLPVAFWIHSGGFQMGTGTVFEGKYFADASVVLVTINYRLGALGFLNTEDGQVLGNMCLKDQVKAMEWVRDNIRHFGGDPAKVMLFGNSAGGSSDLFSTGYSQWNALNPWAFQRNPRKNAIAFAKHAGCAAKNRTTNLDVACLRSKNATELAIAQLKLKTLPIQFDLLNMVFCPSAESPKMGNDSFLTDSP